MDLWFLMILILCFGVLGCDLDLWVGDIVTFIVILYISCAVYSLLIWLIICVNCVLRFLCI